MERADRSRADQIAACCGGVAAGLGTIGGVCIRWALLGRVDLLGWIGLGGGAVILGAVVWLLLRPARPS